MAVAEPPTFLFTSESVCEGHPDKLCDIISDAVLDACVAQDPYSHVACETTAKTGLIHVFGEITTNANVNYTKVVRDELVRVGYTSSDVCLDARTCSVLLGLDEQSQELQETVSAQTEHLDEVAGDQGIMFGYATDETEELMPLTIILAHKLCRRLTEVRKDGTIPWLGPDGKAQVTVKYSQVGGHLKALRIDTVLVSAMHSPGVSLAEHRAAVKKHVIDAVLPAGLVDSELRWFVNPNGSFSIGGPYADSGLTGRKIIVDSYGGWGSCGGGAFSGKDCSKMDRSAAYAARWVAKSIVAAGLAERVVVQLSYAIGLAEPTSLFVDTYGTGKRPDSEILEIVKKNFKLSPGVIIRDLQLRRPLFRRLAAYGHFGRTELDPPCPWEIPKELVLD